MKALDIEPWMHNRFWKLAKRGMPWECWNWSGRPMKGYGRVCIRIDGSIRYEQAHRISFVIHNGPLEIGEIVAHECDNKICVNPFHLELSDSASNTRDAARRGRMMNGLEHANARIHHSEVRGIRERVASGESSMGEEARRFDVSLYAIQSLVCGRTWRCFGGPITPSRGTALAVMYSKKSSRDVAMRLGVV